MKILYVANDRRAAELATFALGAALPDVVVAWAPGLDNAELWIQKNRDVGALIVEIESDKGHDAFLLDEPEFFKVLRGFLDGSAELRGIA